MSDWEKDKAHVVGNIRNHDQWGLVLEHNSKVGVLMQGEFDSTFWYYAFWKSEGLKRCGMLFVKSEYLVKTIKKYFLKKLNV